MAKLASSSVNDLGGGLHSGLMQDNIHHSGFFLKPAHAASLKKIKQRTPLEKLGVIPAFMVTSME